MNALDPAAVAQLKALRETLAGAPAPRAARALSSAEIAEEMRLEQLAEERKDAREGR